jgi:hypothetical protein
MLYIVYLYTAGAAVVILEPILRLSNLQKKKNI